MSRTQVVSVRPAPAAPRPHRPRPTPQHPFSGAPAAPLTLPKTSPSLFTDVRVLMVTLTGFCVFLNVYATQTLLPLFTKLFGASKFEVSLTVSSTTIGIALAAPL